MTKEEMLSAIYDEMADKTLSDGCAIINSDGCTRHIGNCYMINTDVYYEGCHFQEFSDECDKDGYYQIIGHPVRIGDVLDWFDKNNPEHLWGGNGVINGEIIVRKWNNLRLPIDEQSDDCIEFVHNLIKK